MVSETPYKDLSTTLKALKTQVIDSLPSISDYVPDTIKSPEELFYFLRSITTYKKDPKGVELLQMVSTLMKRGGKGDCDCFTILSLTACIYLGFDKLNVILVGRTKNSPSHIYINVWDKEKKSYCIFDLTNPYYDYERKYNFKQTLPFMILKLEDMGGQYWDAKKTAKANTKLLIRERNQSAKASRQAQKQKAKQMGELSNRATRKAKRENRQAVKIAKTNAKTEKKLLKVANKTQRKESRQLRRTDRVEQKQNRKATKRALKVVKKENRTDRVNERQNNRIDRITSKGIEPKELQPQNFTPEGGEEQYNQYSGEEEDPQYNQYSGEEEGYEPEEGEYEEAEYVEGEEEDLEEGLSFFPALAIPSLIKKGISLVKAIKGSKAGSLVKAGASQYAELTKLKNENSDLKKQVEQEKKNKLTYGGIGGGAGLLLGFVAGKLIK